MQQPFITMTRYQTEKLAENIPHTFFDIFLYILTKIDQTHVFITIFVICLDILCIFGTNHLYKNGDGDKILENWAKKVG